MALFLSFLHAGEEESLINISPRTVGFLISLSTVNTVLADRGFNISDDLAIHGATLAIPSFTKNKSQLRQQEVERSQRLSKVRIHVERVIGQLKTKYTILQSTLPVSVVKNNDDQDTANIDKIEYVLLSPI